MKDYIKDLCKKANIKVIFTSNKITVLSNGIQNGNPTLRVHKAFTNCTKETAEAIIGYYTEFDSKNNYLDEIKKYLENNFESKKYKIKAPDKIFKQAVSDSIRPNSLYKQNQSNLKELHIKKIIKSNFFGIKSEINPGETIETSSDDIIELEITVDYIEGR